MQVTWQTVVNGVTYAFDIHTKWGVNWSVDGFIFYQWNGKHFGHSAGTYATVAIGKAAIIQQLQEETR